MLKVVRILIGLALAASAQMESHGVKIYENEGKLLTLRFVPGAKSAKLYLIGKKVAEVGPDGRPELVSIANWNQGRTETLDFKPEGEAYIVTPLPKAASILKIRTRLGEQEEVFDLRLSPGQKK